MKFGKLIGAIDEGTSSARFIIFRAGTDNIVCYHQINVPQIYPQEGWCEQDPMKIISVVQECINGAVKKLEALGAQAEIDVPSIHPQEGWCEQDPTKITTIVGHCIEESIKKLVMMGGTAKDIVAVGITNQRESVVVWDRNTGKPLYNAIIWLDNRTSATVDELVDSIPDATKNINYLKPLCGLPLSPYFSALKLRWLKDNVPIVAKAMTDKTCIFGTIDTWLIFNLTGGAKHGGIHVTDVTNASRTMLMNIETLKWDPVLLQFFKLPASILPEIRSSAEVYGHVKMDPLNGVPVASCLGDQQAALVGQQCLKSGQAKATFGTGCFLLYNTGSSIVYSSHGLLTTVGYQLGSTAEPVYALEGSVAIAGAALSWLKNNMGLIESYEQVETMARTVNSSLDVYFVPAFSGLFAPYWDQEARGVLCGLSEETTTEHIIRATLESVCFQVRDILDSMNKDCGIPLKKLMVDGGMTVNTLFLQLQSDLVGINVVRPRVAETTALGAALAACKGINLNVDLGTPLSVPDSESLYKPQISGFERDQRYRKWKMAVERAFGWDATTRTDKKKRSRI